MLQRLLIKPFKKCFCLIILFKKRSVEFKTESFVDFWIPKIVTKHTILKRYLNMRWTVAKANIKSGHSTLKSNRRHFVINEYNEDDVALITIRI